MTCTGCEEHVKLEIGKLPGISGLGFLMKKRMQVVTFDESKTNIESKIGCWQNRLQSRISKQIKMSEVVLKISNCLSKCVDIKSHANRCMSVFLCECSWKKYLNPYKVIVAFIALVIFVCPPIRGGKSSCYWVNQTIQIKSSKED